MTHTILLALFVLSVSAIITYVLCRAHAGMVDFMQGAERGEAHLRFEQLDSEESDPNAIARMSEADQLAYLENVMSKAQEEFGFDVDSSGGWTTLVKRGDTDQ